MNAARRIVAQSAYKRVAQRLGWETTRAGGVALDVYKRGDKNSEGRQAEPFRCRAPTSNLLG